MASAGARDTNVQIQSSSFDKVDGVPTETWNDTRALWANVEVRSPSQNRVEAITIDVQNIRLRFDWLDGQAITEADRFIIRGKAYEVVSIDWDTDRRAVVIVDVRTVTTGPGATEAEWEKKMRDGEIVRIQDRTREDAAGRPKEVFVRAKAEFLQPDELVGGIAQGARRYFVMAKDVDADFGPIKRGQFVRVRDDRLFIESVDDATYRIGGDLIVYVLLTRGNTGTDG